MTSFPDTWSDADKRQWEANNATHWGADDPNVPQWRKSGFNSEADYNGVYPPAPPQGAYVPPARDYRALPVDAPDPFGDYLTKNPNAKDSWSYLDALLQDYGLGDLSSFAKDNIIQGRSSNEIVQRLRETPTYKTRFAAIEQRKEKGLPAISEGEVVAYEKQATQLMRAAGMPPGFYDKPEDFLKLQVADVSLAELQNRVTQGYVAAESATPEVRDQLQNMYGVTKGGLAAYFIDPDRTHSLIMQQFNAAQRGAEAQRTGYGNVSASEAEGLVQTGVTNAQANQGFGKLAQSQQLFTGLAGQNVDDITRQQQFGAVFDGNTNDQQAIERRGKERTAQYQGTGGYARSNQGAVGLGVAQ